MSRILPFQTVYNFRDFGQYPGYDGQLILGGRLFRSAHLHHMSGPDIARFEDLRIGVIIDMRYEAERKKQPNQLPADHKSTTLAYSPGANKDPLAIAPHEAFMAHDLKQAEDARFYMMNSYKERPLDIGFQSLARASLKHMAKTGDNILIHCAAGKDRTGTLAALILHMLGAEREVILEDYMLTMTAVDLPTLLEMASVKLSEKHGRRFNPDMLAPLFGVSEDYLQQSFITMGDIDHYIEAVLRITPKEKAAIAAYYRQD